MIDKTALEELYLNQRLSSNAIGRKVGANGRTIRKWLKRRAIPRRSVSEAITLYPKTNFSNEMREKAYLLGLRAGDFHAKKIHSVIRMQTTTTHPAQIELFQRSFGKYSHVGKHLFFNRGFDSQEWFLYCDLNESFSFILQKPERIPEWAMGDDACFCEFLAGYSDCEGSWKTLRSHKNATRFVFQLSNQDKEILEQLVEGLTQRGYLAHLYLDVKAGFSRYGKRINRDMYRIMVYRRQDVIRLASELLPLSRHWEKIEKMKMILASGEKSWKEIETEVVVREKIRGGRLQRRLNP